MKLPGVFLIMRMATGCVELPRVTSSGSLTWRSRVKNSLKGKKGNVCSYLTQPLDWLEGADKD